MTQAEFIETRRGRHARRASRASAIGRLMRLDWARRSFIVLFGCALLGWIIRRSMLAAVRQEFA